MEIMYTELSHEAIRSKKSEKSAPSILQCGFRQSTPNSDCFKLRELFFNGFGGSTLSFFGTQNLYKQWDEWYLHGLVVEFTNFIQEVIDT